MKFFMDEYEAGSDLAEYLTGRPGESKSDFVSALAERDGFEIKVIEVRTDPKTQEAFRALALLDYTEPGTPEYAALTEKLRHLPSGLPDTFGEEADSEPASA